MYKDENIFSEEERESIYSLSVIVCHILNVDLEEVRSPSRKGEYSDARKIISHYAYHNLAVRRKGKVPFTLALTSWFLNRDHGTINNLVNICSDLYTHDGKFREAYDEVMSCISKNTPDPRIYKLREKEVINLGLSWDLVRRGNHSFKTRDHYLPDKVLDGVKQMFSEGYSIPQIGVRYYISDYYIRHLCKKHEMVRLATRSSLIKHNLVKETHSVKFGTSKSVAY
jgi:hypothetical protein